MRMCNATSTNKTSLILCRGDKLAGTINWIIDEFLHRVSKVVAI